MNRLLPSIIFAICVVPSTALAAKAKQPPPTAVEPAPPMVSTGHGPQRRTIALDTKRAKGVYKVSAAPGLATVIELPELWTVQPTCGDCVFGDTKPEGQLWRLDVFPDTRSLSIKPTRLPGPDAPSSAFVTNIDVSLDGGISITLFVELTLPEQADARVEFSLPDEDKGAAKLTKRERALEERFDDRVKTVATEQMLSALMAGTTCKDFFGRPNRSDNVVVRLKQICRNGALTYVTFEVENRRRADLFLASAALEGSKQRAAAGEKLEKTTLRFNERGKGIASVASAGGVDGPESYKLTVTEEGVEGEKSVVVEDISF